MSNHLNSKEEEILRKQKALSSKLLISQNTSKPSTIQPVPSQSHTGQSSSLSSLLGQESTFQKKNNLNKTTSSSRIPKKSHVLYSNGNDKVTLNKVSTSSGCNDSRKDKSQLLNDVIDLTDSPDKKMSSETQKRFDAKDFVGRSSTAMKRPSAQKRRRVEEVIHATRMRIQEEDAIKEHRQKSQEISSSSTVRGGGLAALLTQAGVTDEHLKAKQMSWNEADDREESSLDIEDFYSFLREWDFLKDWSIYRDNDQSKGLLNNKESITAHGRGIQGPSVVLPDVFISRKQYQKLWAPLCLEETRSQILSDAASLLPWRKRENVDKLFNHSHGNRNQYIALSPVTVRHTQDSSNFQSLILITEPRDDLDGPKFSSADVVVLALNESDFLDASVGRLHKSRKNISCVVGNVKYSRRSTDGLKIVVSRKLWFQISNGESEKKMYILNLGSSVTNVREFTALSRINTIELLPYILGRRIKKETKIDSSSSHKMTHLTNMGGKAVLGEGFLNYAASNYNHSQLAAISAAASEYGKGGFTLVKGPPGTGKTTTLVALLNALHIRQFNQYYERVHSVVAGNLKVHQPQNRLAVAEAAKQKPRLLVCAPSNNAIDNVIQKVMERGFIDGTGQRYNPSIVRIGIGQSEDVKDVSLNAKVDELLTAIKNPEVSQSVITAYRSELSRIRMETQHLQHKLALILSASEYPLPLRWEVRVGESNHINYVNHEEKRVTLECPPPPEPGEKYREMRSMPEYKIFLGQLVKLVDKDSTVSSTMEVYRLCQSNDDSLRQQLETYILDTTHIVCTTLGTAGSSALESCSKFEVIVVDEAAQSVEPSTLVALQLGSSHAILVGDPQQLPATIFSTSGRTTKFDRSLFQRLEEAGHEVHLLDTQYRMHPEISSFPRRIFYGGYLKDGPNVSQVDYGNPLREELTQKFPYIHPFTIFNIDSSEEKYGSSLSNSFEASFALELYKMLKENFGTFLSKSQIAVITPYSQQVSLLRKMFARAFGPDFAHSVNINTVDSFQGREANVVIFSCVRAAQTGGIGFLSDVRRMNVALTRAKHFLFVIARCQSISRNQYWNQLVNQARDSDAVVNVPSTCLESGQDVFDRIQKGN